MRPRRIAFVVLAAFVMFLGGGAFALRRDIATWRYGRSFSQAASNTCTCVFGPLGEIPSELDEALDAVRVGYLVTPVDPARPWPARCRPWFENALDVYEDAKKARVHWAEANHDRAAILAAVDRGDLGPARALLGELWPWNRSEPDPSIPPAPKRPNAAISVKDARPFVTGATLPTSHRIERGELHLFFDEIECTLSPNGKSSCELPQRLGLSPIPREPGGPEGWLRRTASTGERDAVFDKNGTTLFKLPDNFPIQWARGLADGRFVFGSIADTFFEHKDGKTTRVPGLWDPIDHTFFWATFVDRWFVFADADAIQAVDLARRPLVRTKIGPSTRNVERFARTDRSCIADSTYLAFGRQDPALIIFTKNEWQYVALDQPALGRHLWCDGEAAVITDWMPLAIERCADANCAPIPVAPVSAKIEDEFAANRTHVWQLERWNGLFTVRVWPIAEPNNARRVVLVDWKELGRKSVYLREQPALHAVKDRAYVVFERKGNGEAVVISVDTQAKASVVVAGE